MYRSRHGLNSSDIPGFLEEFVFRKRHLFKKDDETKESVFLKILKLFVVK
jgi:hypothetical protein